MGEVLNLVFVMSMKNSTFYKDIQNKVLIDGDLYIRILTCNDVRNLKTSIKSEWGGGGARFQRHQQDFSNLPSIFRRNIFNLLYNKG